MNWNVRGSDHGITGSTIPEFFQTDWGKPQKSMRVARSHKRNWTVDLPNITQEGYAPDILSF
jgi:hypothetical protein